jgi:hypothetical protein
LRAPRSKSWNSWKPSTTWGLHVQTRLVYDDDGRRYVIYCGQMDHRSITVTWRESEGWQAQVSERGEGFAATTKLPNSADQTFANGDPVICEGSRALLMNLTGAPKGPTRRAAISSLTTYSCTATRPSSAGCASARVMRVRSPTNAVRNCIASWNERGSR